MGHHPQASHSSINFNVDPQIFLCRLRPPGILFGLFQVINGDRYILVNRFRYSRHRGISHYQDLAIQPGFAESQGFFNPAHTAPV